MNAKKAAKSVKEVTKVEVLPVEVVAETVTEVLPVVTEVLPVVTEALLEVTQPVQKATVKPVRKDSTPHEKVMALEAVLHDELAVNGELLKVTKLYVGVYRNNKLVYLSPSFKGDSVAVLLKDTSDKEALQIFDKKLQKAGATAGAYRGTSAQVLEVIKELKKTDLGVWA